MRSCRLLHHPFATAKFKMRKTLVTESKSRSTARRMSRAELTSPISMDKMQPRSKHP